MTGIVLLGSIPGCDLVLLHFGQEGQRSALFLSHNVVDFRNRYLERAFCNLITIGVHDYHLSDSIAVVTSVGITQKKYDALVSLGATFPAHRVLAQYLLPALSPGLR